MSDEVKKNEEGQKAAKSVKVRALRPFLEGAIVINPGQTVAVAAERASELTKDDFTGPFDFAGERIEGTRDFRRANLKKAEVVA